MDAPRATVLLLAFIAVGCSGSEPADFRAPPLGTDVCPCGDAAFEPDARPAGDASDAQTAPSVGADAAVACEAEHARASASLTHGPVLGAVTDRSVKVWARTSEAAAFRVVFWPAGRFELRRCGVSAATDTALDFTGVVELAGLNASSEYAYVVYLGDEAATGELSFRTLPPADQPGRIRFAFGADVDGGDVPGFTDIEAVDPDFVIMLGDNVYADGADRTYAGYRGRYQYVWSGEQFQQLFARVPSFAIWDDHELVNNYWFGKNDEVYAFGRRLFNAYQGGRNPAPQHAGDLYYSFRAGEVGFFVLDTRSHRSANDEPDTADKSMLGAEQKRALADWLEEDASKIHVIVSSVLMHRFTTTGNDSWQGFTAERTEILGIIAELSTRNAMVISGDQHWSAVLSIEHGDQERYKLYEFQATPLGFTERGAPASIDETVIALDNTHQVFGVFDVDTSVEPPALDYTLCAVGSPCSPGMEPPPPRSGLATIPYALRFEGGPRGLRLVTLLD